MSAGRLAGRVAFVTGGLRGIGHAAAARMLDEGATVIVSDLDSESDAHDLLGDLADRVGYVQANVTDEGDWARALDHVKQAHDACHILVNNAGIDLTGAVETLELEDWRRIMAINVDGVFMGTKRFVPLMAESGSAVEGGSSIVNVSSIMGLVGYASESATKGMPIRANSVHPGFVETPLLKAGFQRWVDKGVAEKPQDLVDAMNAATPMGRLAQPREIAAGIAFLAGPDASYMTGSEMVIDGGWTAQ